MTMETSRPILIFVLFLLSILLFCNSANAKRSPPFPAFINARLKKSSDSGGGLYETRNFTQILDHFDFNPESYETFQQRYLVNHTYWGGKGAPIFVYTGNEGDIAWFAQNAGFLYETAPHFKALLVFIEHRYYGESIPFGSTDIAYNNATTLGYLSTTQALADYATFIIDLKKNLSSEESPVVVFGGSYGGMLAAWFRLKYPHIAIGALASSAPILQFDDLVSPYTFYDIITNDFRSESENCYKLIKNSWKEIDHIARQHGGLEKIQKSFKLCDIYEGLGVEDWIETALVYTAMTDYPTESNFLVPLPAYPVKQMCNAINNPKAGNDILSRLYGAMNIYYNYSGTETCFYTSGSDEHGMAIGWDWQSCTEMILPTGASNNESIFPPSTYDYAGYAVDCRDYYRVAPRPHWITTEFGGHDIRRVLKRFGSNIIFFNGLRDPWSGGGVLKSLSESLIAIVAPEGAHHVDLRFSTKEDPKWLKKIRKKEVKIISRWLEQYYIDSRST